MGDLALIKNMPENSDYKKIIEWLKEYHSIDNVTKKAKLKTKIVAQMIPVVKHIAKTIARRSTDPIEDMIQAGFIGLLKAIDNYSPAKNDNFKVYAGYLIIGEMKHFLRDKLNMIRVPAHIHELSIRINNFTKTLTDEELEKLTIKDVAKALNTNADTVNITMQIERRKNMISLEDIIVNDEINSLSYEEVIADEKYKKKAENEDFKIILNNLIENLPEQQKVLVEMFYKQDMTKKEIAEKLNISQMAVNRRMKSAFNIIAKHIEEVQIAE